MLSRVNGQPVPCRFCGSPDGEGHLFWECTFPPLVEIRENPEFHDLMREEKTNWPRRLCFGMVGCLMLVWVLMVPHPWAADASESACLLRLRLLLVGTLLGWFLSGVTLLILMLMIFLHVYLMHPKVWSDGSMVLDSVTGVSAAGAGMLAHQSELCWGDRRWGHVDRVQSGGVANSCWGFVSVPWSFADCSEG